MNDKITYLETTKGNYPLIFTLNVMEAIQDKYESLDKWKKLVYVSNNKEPNIKALIFGMTQMINEGIEITNEDSEIKLPAVNEKQVGRIITEVGLAQASKTIGESVIKANENTPEKNA